MGLPVSCLAVLLVLLVHESLVDRLPGSESLARLIGVSPVLVVPWLLARYTATRVGGALQQHTKPSRWVRLLLHLQAFSVPAAFALLLGYGDLDVFATRWSPSLGTGQLLLLLGPPLLMEMSLRLAEHRTVRWLDLAGAGVPTSLGLDRLRMVALVLVPIVAVAICGDVLALDRGLDVFFRETTLGLACALLVLGGLMCVVLPFVFRLVMPLSVQLPANVVDTLRETARALGFAPRNLLMLRSKHRYVNAALVGPLPWPRYLVLTDGLLALLDRESLRGVVAHEIGHAKGNHPGLLILWLVVLPVLLGYTVFAAGLFEFDDTVLAFGGGALLLPTWWWVRRIAHRFELEADQLSAEALGNHECCATALRRVGELSPRDARRASFRHPSQERRIDNMVRCATDPDYRRRFWQRGRRLRRGMALTMGLAVIAFAWAQLRLWPSDRAVYLFLCGRFGDAQVALDELPSDVPDAYVDTLAELRVDVRAARSLGLDEGDWPSVRDEMSRRALQQARAVARVSREPRELLPWLSLALHEPASAPWLQSIYRFCRAAIAGDTTESERLRAHTLALGPPEPFAAWLRG